MEILEFKACNRKVPRFAGGLAIDISYTEGFKLYRSFRSLRKIYKGNHINYETMKFLV